jgi:hypothetical protein
VILEHPARTLDDLTLKARLVGINQAGSADLAAVAAKHLESEGLSEGAIALAILRDLAGMQAA